MSEFNIRTLCYIDDETRITLTECDHSPSITISGSQLRQIALNPDNNDRIDHLKVLVKALEDYEKDGVTRSGEWIEMNKKYITDHQADGVGNTIKPSMIINDIKKMAVPEKNIDKKKMNRIILP